MEKIKKVKKETFVFLIISFIVLISVLIGAMAFFTMVLTAKSEQVISDVGNLYMSGISKEISMHFDTTINLRLNQLETVVTRNNNFDEYRKNYKDFLVRLEYEGKICDFSCLALLSDNEEFQMIYGEQFDLADPQPFFDSMRRNEKKVAIAKDESGKDVIVMGIATPLPMENGGTSLALVGGISVEYIDYILSLDMEDNASTLTYSHIIRRDGSFIIRSSDVIEENYFDRMRASYEDYNGRTVKQYIDELKQAMENNESYFTAFSFRGELRSFYCTHLPNSEWYLVTVMPYSEIDNLVNELEKQRIINFFISMGIVLFFVAILFIVYFKMTQKQIDEIESARNEATRANKAKSEFLSNMSHDIRTPMNAIVGMTAIAITNVENRQQVQTCLKKISLSSKHLLGLINDILDMSKIESGKMTLNMDSVSLREITDALVNIVQPQMKSKNHHFDVIIRDIQTENVFCDSVRLNQIILNLLSNAIKFTPNEGSIQLTLYQENSELGDDYVKVHIIVKDNGIGMSPEFREKVFESFAREDSKRVHKTEGTGLGMAITKYIVDAMKGTINVTSEQGKGTEFHVTVDLEKVTDTDEEMILPSWHMLVVDDDKEICMGVINSLTEIGVQAEWALDGESALKKIEENHTKRNDYHIILLDWKLPGIDGIETARRIHRIIDEDIPIILISAYDCNEIENEAKDAGVAGFISKPLFKSTLFYGLRQFAGNVEEFNVHTEEKKMELKGLKVLVAEDNELNWEIASELLSAELGLELEPAENGQICVDKFKSSPVGYYSAILMDVRMPVMNGLEATEAIRKLDRADVSLPIIAMTADAFSEDIKRCLDSGMNAHIAKPIDVGEVGKVLDKFINGK